ncbi:non-ribosomal peptide synthetase [Bacillus safensis]|uniref:non-ribosomal peptide synthetase family protein n=1 Tax=Bacillus safensis TaxID=561879 RepID=UPI0019347FAA|nr:non-ribosomal peptide synthetase [Bacillus safensis]QRF31060.1 amino acid adenylation domain-containing protein [Bacillus safensis]
MNNKNIENHSQEERADSVQIIQEEIMPLSYAQQRIWFLDQLVPNSSLYNLPLLLNIKGELCIDLWENSLISIINQHEILRTTFKEVNGEICQVISDSINWNMDFKDLSCFNNKEDEVKRLINKKFNKPFDLTKGPLIRATLIQKEKNNYVFLLNMHHIISDGWSLNIIMQKLQQNYLTLKKGKQLKLPHLSIQYADYAVWQHKYLNEKMFEKKITYWKNKLRGIKPLISLPIDHSRPAVQTYRGGIHTINLPVNLMNKLNEISKREGVTLFMTLLTGFKLLLFRYTGQEDIVIGSPVAGRDIPETEELIGCFINTLVFRTNVSGGLTFKQLLNRVNKTSLEAFSNREIPFEKLVEKLQIKRSLSHSPLIQVMFTLQNIQLDYLSMDDIRIEPLDIEFNSTMSKFDLSLTMSESKKGLICTFEYNKDLFEKSTIIQMMKHFENILNEIVNTIEVPINSISLVQKDLMPKNEIYNKCDLSSSANQSFLELFTDQANLFPKQIAISFDNQSITYKDLNENANKFANYLKKYGVGSEEIVGVCVERSINMVICILGILKAGGCFVPIDPSFPKERIRYIIEDSKTSLIITNKQFSEYFAFDNSKIIYLDEESDLIKNESKEASNNLINENQLAYVIYTSGSTGNPKGVMVEHRSLNNFINAVSQAVNFKRNKPIIAVTTISFDIFMLEILLPLTIGQHIILASEKELSDAESLTNLIKKYDVKMMQTTPSRYRLFLQNKSLASSLMNLSEIMVGGEALTKELLEGLRRNSNAQIFNMYGPTETTIWSAIKDVTHSNISIGKPISNTQMYILDSSLQLQPIGVVGDLFISGDGVARGYLNKPELTKQRFFKDHFKNKDLMYKTGDLAKLLPNGEIQFIGREDDQVKVRGYRIELGEIEAAIRKNESIEEIIILTNEDHQEENILIGYYIEKKGSNISSIELKDYVSKFLPNYMVPSYLIKLDFIPITPNGKLNKKALPLPREIEKTFINGYTPPRNNKEKVILHHWKDVLGENKISIYDDFFEIGGHSLSANKLIFKLREEFNIHIPLRILFEYPTIAGMAENIESLNVIGEEELEKHQLEYLLNEVSLDSSIQPTEPFENKDTSYIDNVFLTGATGFLGAFLLRDLLKMSSTKIYCLVRANSTESGFLRIQNALKKYEIWNEKFKDRIIPIVGDLSRPLFGLTEEKFLKLASDISVIYHNGALVNFIYPYDALKKSNVLGTEEILRLACLKKIKPVHFISTIYVFSNSEEGSTKFINEEHMPTPEHLGGSIGYTESKWVAENIIQIARKRGIPVSIYRCGRLTGDLQTGACQKNDLIWRIIAGCIEMKMAPTELGKLNLVPVNYASKSIVKISISEEMGGNFHIYNSESLDFDDVITVIEKEGFKLERKSMKKWLDTINKEKEGSIEALGSFLMDSKSDKGTIIFDSNQTNEILQKISMYLPKVDVYIFKRILGYFIRNNYFTEIPSNENKTINR